VRGLGRSKRRGGGMDIYIAEVGAAELSSLLNSGKRRSPPLRIRWQSLLSRGGEKAGKGRDSVVCPRVGTRCGRWLTGGGSQKGASTSWRRDTVNP